MRAAQSGGWDPTGHMNWATIGVSSTFTTEDTADVAPNPPYWDLDFAYGVQDTAEDPTVLEGPGEPTGPDGDSMWIHRRPRVVRGPRADPRRIGRGAGRRQP